MLFVSVLNDKADKRKISKRTSEKNQKGKQSWPHYNQAKLKLCKIVKRVWALDLDLSLYINFD